MSERVRSAAGPILVVLVLLVMGMITMRHHAASPSEPDGRLLGQISEADVAGTFHFASDVAPADRDAFLTAVDDAQPAARRLIDRVDGLVDVDVATTLPGTVGTTRRVDGRFQVTVNLGGVVRRYGRRGMDRTVLHELGHVIDFALVPPALAARLDAGIPAGYGCDQGLMGGCANARERFAETFAKWATGDIGIDLDLGYKVLPPTSLADWGAPLAALSGAATT